MSIYNENGAWDIIQTRTYVSTHKQDVQKFHIELTLKRRSTFYVVNLMLPIAAMGALNLLVFLLPPGDRVGFSITVLLAVAVFLTIASDSLPKISTPGIPLLCIKLLIDMLISVFVMLFTVVGLRIYHTDTSTTVPPCLASFTRCMLCRCCCLDRSKIILYEKEEFVPAVYDSNVFSHDHTIKEPVNDYDLPENETDHVNKDITWTDVGKAFDVFFFFFTLSAFITSHTVYIIHIYLL